MKGKKLAIILGASLLAMTVTGCTHFGSFLPPKLEEVEINTTPSKDFVKDDRPSEFTEFEVVGHYSNGKEKVISKDEVEFYYKSNETGSVYGIETAIPAAGSYSIFGKHNGVTSNEYDFIASNTHVYAESFEFANGAEEISVAPNASRTFQLSISPRNYTEGVYFTVDDPTIARVERLSSGDLQITGLNKGATNLRLSLYNSPKFTKLENILRLVVDEIYVENIEFIYDYSISSGDELPVELVVTPSNYTVDIWCDYCTEEGIYWDKNSETSYIFYPESTGEITVYFSAKSSPTEYGYFEFSFLVDCEARLEIDIYGTHQLSLDEEAQINVYVSPHSLVLDGPNLVDNYDHSVIKVEQINNFAFDVTPVAYGTTILEFEAMDVDHNVVKGYHQITVSKYYATSISVNGPDTIRAASSTVVTLNIEPADFNANTYVTNHTPSIVNVHKEDELTYKILGLLPGTAWITFFAESSEDSAIRVDYKVSVMSAPANKVKMSQTYHDFVYNTTKSIGHARLLVIPIWFQDSWKYIGGVDPFKGHENMITMMKHRILVSNDIEQAFFGKPVKETGWYSLASYYAEDSNGKLDVTGTVSQWYTVSQTSIEFHKNGNWNQTCLDAVEWYFKNNPNDSRFNYDSDGDGVIDGIALIYGAPDENTYAYYEQFGDLRIKLKTNGILWGTTRGFGGKYKNYNNPGPNKFFDASYDFMYNSLTAKLRANTPHHRSSIPYVPYDPTCFCHEYGHVLGLPDLYDTADENTSNFSSGLNMQTDNKGYHDPFSSLALGWANPYIPTDSCTIFINDYGSSHDMIVLPSPKWNDYNSPFDEYLVIKLDAATGVNKIAAERLKTFGFLKENPGIRLYHVNATLYNKTYKRFTNDTQYGDGLSSSALAFNNTPTSTCAASDRGGMYDEFGLVHLIRHDNNAGTSSAIDYYNMKGLRTEHLFRTGDSFNFEDYKLQFVVPYTYDHSTLDFLQKCNWEFEVTSIYKSAYSDTWTAAIKLTRTDLIAH